MNGSIGEWFEPLVNGSIGERHRTDPACEVEYMFRERRRGPRTEFKVSGLVIRILSLRGSSA